MATSLKAQERIKKTINTNWNFHKGDIEDFPKNNNDIINWDKVNLPHTWNAIDVTDDEPGYYRGIGWYQKNVVIPSSWKNKDIYIYFEGASQVAEVFINGKSVGNHIGGYNFFSFPISSAVNFDQANNISIKVNNQYNDDIPPLSADFTFYGGIYRDVYLMAVNKVHFDMDNHASKGIFISTPKVTKEQASVLVKGVLSNTNSGNQSLIICSQIFDANGNKIAEKQDKIKATGTSNQAFEQNIPSIKNPNLWSPNSPYLYRIISQIKDAKTGALLDEVSNPLGFRWFSFDADKGFFLNGEHLKLIGTNRHQDFKGLGNALPDALHVRDMELLKAMGGNFLRISHYPQDPEVLEACDRLGILTSVEIPIVNTITESKAFTDNCLTMMTEMIRQDYNHPSVIIWAYMNEVLLRPRYDKGSEKQENYFKAVAKLAQELEDLTRIEDHSRYSMIPCHGNFDLYKRVGLTQIPDIVGWNLYQGWYSGKSEDFAGYLDKHHKELPSKPLIITEYGADVDPHFSNPNPIRFDKSQEYSNKYHQVYLKAILQRPFVAGSAIWNLADFNSEQRTDTDPHTNNKGILTTHRQPKDQYYFYQAHLLKAPFIKIGSQLRNLRSGISDSETELLHHEILEIYSNQPQVTLKVNGKSLGTVKTDFCIAKFDVPFKDGVNQLEATTLVNGKEIKDFVEINYIIIPQKLKSSLKPFTEINVSLGDPRYYMDKTLQQVWLPEQAYQPGSWGYVGGEIFRMKNSGRQSFGTDKNILGTDYDAIYATQREDIKQFKLDVPDGKYELTLHFAELLSDKEKGGLAYNLGKDAENEKLSERSFNVYVNGLKVLENLGTKNELVPEVAYATKISINVKNGTGVVVNFEAIKGKTILNGLQLRRIY
ncbi:glycoside hydrolase family 2 TIM barrel-domain containing protein [Pedobacter segetis]|nr:glycoside hydrolase family 2 TIM barrel-domain containing protein [Pedobacter segetis]